MRERRHQRTDALADFVQVLVFKRLIDRQVVDPLAEMRSRGQFLPGAGRTGDGRYHVARQQPGRANGSMPSCRQVAKHPGLAMLRAARIFSRFSSGRPYTNCLFPIEAVACSRKSWLRSMIRTESGIGVASKICGRRRGRRTASAHRRRYATGP